MTRLQRPGAILQADGKAYSLNLTVNAMVALEDVLKRPTGEVLGEISAAAVRGGVVPMRPFRAVIWAMLRDEHPELDEAAAGRLIDEAGKMEAMEALAVAATAAFPERSAAAKGAEGAEASPPVA